MAGQTDQTIPILDSHIHLYPTSEIPTLAWCKPSNPLATAKTPELYRKTVSDASTTTPPRPFMGAIFIETDRSYPTDATTPADFTGPLQELTYLRRIVEGTPSSPEEGTVSSPEDMNLLKAIIPWAPVHLGAEGLSAYLTEAEKVAGEKLWKLVKGFRYLLQDKPHGTGTEAKFLEGLKELGKRGFVFEVGMDCNRRGRKQMDEMVEMVEQAHEGLGEGEKKVKFVLNHLCKPDFSALHPADPAFVAWKSALYILGKNPDVYMKLSGGLGEMSESLRNAPPGQIFMGTMPWLSTILATFASSKRLMFGSDWPVCTLGIEVPTVEAAAAAIEGEKEGVEAEKKDGEKEKEKKEDVLKVEAAGEKENAWGKWRDVVEKMCYMASLDKESQESIWYKAAMEAYGIEA